VKRQALGLIETKGLVPAVEAADAALKAADVRLLGYELAKGQGLTTIKLEGNVSAVKAAVAAASAAASRVGVVASVHVIPRPHEQIGMLTEDKTVEILKAIPIGVPEIRDVQDESAENENDARKAGEPKPDAKEGVKQASAGNEQQSQGTGETNNIQINMRQEGITEEAVTEEIAEASGEARESATCNLCKDPRCPRKKGEPRSMCIHYRQD